MRSIDFFPFVALLCSFSKAKPLDSRALDMELQIRQDEVAICSNYNPLSYITSSIGDNLPSDYKIAFAGGTYVGTVGGTSAYGACQVYNSGKPEDQQQSCSGWGLTVGGLANVAFSGFVLYRRLGRTGAVTQNIATRHQKRGDQLVEQMETRLRARGVEFTSIFSTPLITRDEVEGHTLEILGVRYPGSNDAMDHKLHMRENGTGVAMASISPPATGSGLAARYLGPGLKINYDVVKANNPSREITDANLQYAGQIVGEDWENRINANPNMITYYGRAELGSDNTIQYGITWESGNFNDDYEDVNACHYFG